MRDKTKFFFLRSSRLINVQVQWTSPDTPAFGEGWPGPTWLKCSCPGSGAPSTGAVPSRSNRRPSCAADRLRLGAEHAQHILAEGEPGTSASLRGQRPPTAGAQPPLDPEPSWPRVAPHGPKTDWSAQGRAGRSRVGAQGRRSGRRRRSGSARWRGHPGPPAPSKAQQPATCRALEWRCSPGVGAIDRAGPRASWRA